MDFQIIHRENNTINNILYIKGVNKMKKVISIAFWRISMLFVFTACGQKVKILRVELPEYSEITVGETIEITPAFEYEGSKEEEINNVVEELTLIWSSSDTSIVTIEDNIVTGISYGDAIISVTTEDNTIYAQTLIKVKSPVEAIIADDIVITDKDTNIEIKYSLLPEGVQANISYELNDENIVKITDGKISAIKQGETYLTIRADDIEKTIKVLVKESKMEKNSLASNVIVVNDPVKKNSVVEAPIVAESSSIQQTQVPEATPTPTEPPNPIPTLTLNPDYEKAQPIPTPEIPAEEPIIAPKPTLDNNENLGDTHNPGYCAADHPKIYD